jgi:hypothetical protein
MSNKNQVSKQASRSHPEESMPGVYGEKSKASLRPVSPANSQPGSTSHPEEALGGHVKKHAVPAHVGVHKEQGQEHDSLSKLNRFDRSVPGDAREVPNGAARARRAGPHGSQIDSSGDNNAAPKKRHLAKIGTAAAIKQS